MIEKEENKKGEKKVPPESETAADRTDGKALIKEPYSLSSKSASS